MYMHPAISRDLNAARRDEDLRRAAAHRSGRAVHRSRADGRMKGARAGPLLRRRLLRQSR